MTKPFVWNASDWWDKQVNRQGYHSTQGQALPGQILWKDLSQAEQAAVSAWFEDQATREDKSAFYLAAGSSIGDQQAKNSGKLWAGQEEEIPFGGPLSVDPRYQMYQAGGAFAPFYSNTATHVLNKIAPELATSRGITAESLAADAANKRTWADAMKEAQDRSFNMGTLGMLATVLSAGALGGAFSGAGAASGGANAMAGSMGLEGIGAAGGAGLGAGTGAAATSYPVDLSNPELLYSHGEILGPPSSLAPESLGGAAATGAGGGIPSVVDGPVSGISPMEGAAEAGTYYNPVTGQTLPYGQVGSTAAPGFSMSQASGLSGLFQSLGLPSELSGILSPLLQGLGSSYLARNMAGNYRDAANNSLAMLWPGREYQQSTFWPAITQGTNTLRNMYF